MLLLGLIMTRTRFTKTGLVFKSLPVLLGSCFSFPWNNATVCVDPWRFNVAAMKTKRNGGEEKKNGSDESRAIHFNEPTGDECCIHMPTAFTAAPRNAIRCK